MSRALSGRKVEAVVKEAEKVVAIGAGGDLLGQTLRQAQSIFYMYPRPLTAVPPPLALSGRHPQQIGGPNTMVASITCLL